MVLPTALSCSKGSSPCTKPRLLSTHTQKSRTERATCSYPLHPTPPGDCRNVPCCLLAVFFYRPLFQSPQLHLRYSSRGTPGPMPLPALTAAAGHSGVVVASWWWWWVGAVASPFPTVTHSYPWKILPGHCPRLLIGGGGERPSSPSLGDAAEISQINKGHLAEGGG